jgi:RNA polymerase sigma factor (sigma-70 family)
LFGFGNGGCYQAETTMCDDAELLRDYATGRSEAAFAELVRRHLGLVYQAALRQVGGDAHLAQDVAQSVFTDLARKAGALGGRAVLAGWLYTSTRYAAVQVVRSERRRRKRELEAQRMSEIFSEESGANASAGESGNPADWARLRPVIDDALHALGERDREAVLLRFFEGRAFGDVGVKLAVSEDAARMRVERALEKLRGLLKRRGVTSTSAALSVALSGQAMAAAPAGLAASVTGAAMTSAAAMTAGGAVGWATFMGMTKLQIGLAGVIVAGGTAGWLVQQKMAAEAQSELARVREESAASETMRAQNRERARVSAEVRELRKDDVEFARLEVEAEVLKKDFAANVAARERLQKAASAGANDKPVFKVSEIDVIPKVKQYGAPPNYPSDLRVHGIEGEAIIHFVVDENGAVRGAEAVKATHEAFAAVAVGAVEKWVFEAGKKGNVPVNVQMVVPIVFSLQGKDGDANTWF